MSREYPSDDPLYNHMVWRHAMRELAEALREQGYDEETVYEHLVEEAGEGEEELVEILYSDDLYSGLPVRILEKERDDMITRLNFLIDKLGPKVRSGDAEAIQLAEKIQGDIDELERGRPT